jgi:sRNA-binding carbon storage regulator CsrA
MPILMTRKNPEGVQLADHVRELVIEIVDKNARLGAYSSPEAAAIRNNNTQIMGLLMQIEGIQRKSLALVGGNIGR